MILLDDCFQVENKRFLNKENGTDVSLNVCEDEAGEGVVRDGQNFEVVEGLGGEVQLHGIVCELQGVLLAAFLVFPLKPERDRVGALILDTLPERVIEFEKKKVRNATSRYLTDRQASKEHLPPGSGAHLPSTSTDSLYNGIYRQAFLCFYE